MNTTIKTKTVKVENRYYYVILPIIKRKILNLNFKTRNVRIKIDESYYHFNLAYIRLIKFWKNY